MCWMPWEMLWEPLALVTAPSPNLISVVLGVPWLHRNTLRRRVPCRKMHAQHTAQVGEGVMAASLGKDSAMPIRSWQRPYWEQPVRYSGSAKKT